ncbi:acyltransferase family protein [Xanthobacter sp. TB0139]|uniref:acyltransferase family protein n=1 Tax=Xanthobacter sp. TB0139 TaxID=3459178 RepID=UPI00403A6555
MRYRADISGLRALAVIPVVLFHADPRLVPGGFVGVDVFFVISGYLITSILAADLAQARFSLARFYDRRVRRILPAYVLVAACTAIAALIWFTPRMLEDFGASLRYASVFFANRYFLSATGYFAPTADEQPLLHTWSLAIEEQFYLIWPLLLFALFQPRLARFRPYVVFALIAVSLFVATRNAVLRPPQAFFNFEGRAWELLLGAALALGYLPRPRGRWLPELIALAGVGAIVAAIILYDSHTIFPGASALLPTLGALAVLWAGQDGRVTWMGRLLSLSPLVWVGLISYSLYLWHWPILSFMRLYIGPHLSLVQLLAGVGAAVALAAFSWRFVEHPFRAHGPTTLREELRHITLGLAALAVLVGVGAAFSLSGGFPGRANEAARQAEEAAHQHWAGSAHCLVGPGISSAPADCRFGLTGDDTPLMALWGDSLADQHGATLDELARAQGYGVVQLTKAGCAPLLPGPQGSGLSNEARACDAFRAESLKAILDNPRVRLVVIGGAWIGQMVRGADGLAPLAAAVRRLTDSGRGVVLVAPPVPFETGGGRCVARQRFAGFSEARCARPAHEAAAGLAPVEGALKAIAMSSPRVRLVLPRHIQCDGAMCRPVLADGAVAMTDGGHLNVAGSMALMGELAAALKSLEAKLPNARP